MKKITFLFLCLLLTWALSCTNPTKLITEDKAFKANLVSVHNPDRIKNAKKDPHLLDETAIVVSKYAKGNYYVGKVEYPIEVVGKKIGELLEKSPGERDSIYLNGEQDMPYEEMVKLLDLVRKVDVDTVNLVVTPEIKDDMALRVFKVKLLPEPKFDDTEGSYEKPADGKYLDFIKDKMNVGTSSESVYEKSRKPLAGVFEEEFQTKIAALLKEREDKKVFKKGTSEIDKRVFIRASKANPYRKVARLIDAAIGAGASEIYLVIDDLD